jgi:hypothetical protein
MMMHTAMTLALTLFVAACANTAIPMAPAAEDVSGKQFAPPPPGLAALYIFRANKGTDYTIIDGQKTLGTLGANNWMRVELPPGSHNFHCAVPKYSDLVSSTVVFLSPGNIAYLSASLWESGFSCHLVSEDADIGVPAVRRGSRVNAL